MKNINPTIILVRPQLPENIGMTARVMDNFGLSKLYVVNPRDGWPSKMAENSAKHGINIIKKTKNFTSLIEAVSKFNLVIATTNRRRFLTRRFLTRLFLTRRENYQMHRGTWLAQERGAKLIKLTR